MTSKNLLKIQKIDGGNVFYIKLLINKTYKDYNYLTIFYKHFGCNEKCSLNVHEEHYAVLLLTKSTLQYSCSRRALCNTPAHEEYYAVLLFTKSTMQYSCSQRALRSTPAHEEHYAVILLTKNAMHCSCSLRTLCYHVY